jgi:cellulose synthase/poly-beta-1,6-N-acetylglucosamine synthase-like glycosyltransferase
VRAGAEVVERNDPTLRGKGYALDYGLRALAADAPEVVLVVDADCMVEDGALTRLATSCAETGRPVQALYLMRTPPGAHDTKRIAEFAWRVKNWARPLGLHRIGLPCELMGTGMAFPWTSLAGVELASGHIAEDMKLGVDLAKNGLPPLFCPGAIVWSTFAANAKGADSQRTRWEHGHLSLIAKDMPALLGVGLRRLDFRLVAMALDLLVPPTALLAMLVVAWWTVTIVPCLLLPISSWPAVLATLDGVAFFAAIAIVWAHYGRSIVPFSAIVATALYAVKKIPLYARFLVNRQAEWVRSERDERGR